MPDTPFVPGTRTAVCTTFDLGMRLLAQPIALLVRSRRALVVSTLGYVIVVARARVQVRSYRRMRNWCCSCMNSVREAKGSGKAGETGRKSLGGRTDLADRTGCKVVVVRVSGGHRVGFVRSLLQLRMRATNSVPASLSCSRPAVHISMDGRVGFAVLRTK